MASCRNTSPLSPHPSGSEDRYVILPLVLAGILMAVVDGSVVSIALPTIMEYFRVNPAQSQMIMTSYLVTLTSLLMVFGKVAEYVGPGQALLPRHCLLYIQFPGLRTFHKPEPSCALQDISGSGSGHDVFHKLGHNLPVFPSG